MELPVKLVRLPLEQFTVVTLGLLDSVNVVRAGYDGIQSNVPLKLLFPRLREVIFVLPVVSIADRAFPLRLREVRDDIFLAVNVVSLSVLEKEIDQSAVLSR